MRLVGSILFIFTMALFIGCSAHTNIMPVGQGNTDVNVSVGGPIVSAFNTKIPIPYFTVGAVHGVSPDMNINANLHLLTLPYKLFGCDFGASFFPVKNKGYMPEIGIHPMALALISLKKDVDSRMRVYPSFTSTFAWRQGENYIYTGFDFTIPLTKPDYNSDASGSIFSPFVGYKMELGKKLRLVTEVKWQAANIQTNQLAAEYVHISGNGAIGILFSFERSF